MLEDPDLKAKVFAQFHQICQPKTVFTTNTSTLLPSMWAEATGRPAQFAALHFYDVFEHNLVDVMPHPGTSPEIVELLAAFAKRIKQVPLVFKKEHPGYVSNAIFEAHELSGDENSSVGQSHVRGGRGPGGHDSPKNAHRNFRNVGRDRTGYHLACYGEQRQDIRRHGRPAMPPTNSSGFISTRAGWVKNRAGAFTRTLTPPMNVQNSLAATPSNKP